MDDYSIASIMSTDVLSVGPHASIGEITRFMSQNQYSCLPVVQDGKPIGIITERDIVRFYAGNVDNIVETSSLQALDIMSYDLILMNQEQSLLDALVVSIANKVRHLPVIDDSGFLKGIVTYTDIVNVQRDVLELQTSIIERSIKQRTAKLIAANKILRKMSLVDPLLGIGNRRAMEIDIECTHDLSRRYLDPYAIAMIDIDNFKLYNDHYGHQAGDKTLQLVAETIKNSVRETDRIYRYGGEEILLLLPKTDVDTASHVAERVIFNLQSKKIPHTKSIYGIVTVSCGVAIYGNEGNLFGTDWADVIKSADIALYAAKSAGRNCVELQYQRTA